MTKSYKNLWIAARKFTVYSPPLQLPALPPLPHRRRRRRDKESNKTGFGKAESNKQPSAEGELHTVRNKLKEDLQITWHTMRLLQMSEREKLPKLKTNSKLIKLQEEILE